MSVRSGAGPRRLPLTIKTNRVYLEEQIVKFIDITQIPEHQENRTHLDLYKILGLIHSLDVHIKYEINLLDENLLVLQEMKEIIAEVQPSEIRPAASAQRVLADIGSNRKAAQLAGPIFTDQLDR